VQSPKVQSIGNTAVPTDPVAQGTSVESTTATHTQTQGQSTAAAKVPAQVAVTPSQLSATNSESKPVTPLPVTPAADATVAQATPAAPANADSVLEQLNRYSREGNSNSQDQVTNVTQLSDVRPTDWAYEALRSLVERYGCIAGYPDGTYRGNRALSRYEFAAGLNACLQQVERLIAAGTADFVTRKDLETLQRLVDEFRTELATLGTRVDKLEGRVAFLEDHQFSTTTKLQGEAIFALTDEFNQGLSNNTVFQDRVRLTFNTSFTGRDRLVTRLAAGNGDPSNLFSTSDGFTLSEGQQTFNLTGGSSNNSVVLDWLAYYFNFGASKVYLAATGGIHSDYAPTLNPYFEDYDGGNGALSTFASESPIYRIGGGAGAAISLGVGPLQSILGPSTLTLGYLAGSGAFGANNPIEKAGIADGDYAALAQLNFNLGDRIGIGATYVHGYHNSGTAIFDAGGSSQATLDRVNGTFSGGFGVVGSTFANNPSALVALSRGLPLTPVVTNSYGVEAAFRLSDNISISGFGSYTNAILIGQGTGDIWTYGGGVAFSDFGKKGNILGLFAGVEPTLRGLSNSVRPAQGFSRDNSWHFEGFYKYQLSENISVTPGIIWLTSPGQNENNDDAVIGTLRTTFTF
jgi:BMFP domain-containing protein YqiC